MYYQQVLTYHLHQNQPWTSCINRRSLYLFSSFLYTSFIMFKWTLCTENESHTRLIFVKRGKKNLRFHDAARVARGEAFVQNFAFKTSWNTFSSIVLSRHFFLNTRHTAQFFSNSNFQAFFNTKINWKKKIGNEEELPTIFLFFVTNVHSISMLLCLVFLVANAELQ